MQNIHFTKYFYNKYHIDMVLKERVMIEVARKQNVP